MTRINLVDPAVLTDQHLMAEYRELPMIGAALRRSLASPRPLPAIPPRYLLNKGHVTFFYDKRDFLEQRYAVLIEELQARGFRLDPDRRCDFTVFDALPRTPWLPGIQDLLVNIERILERVAAGPSKYRYRSKVIDYEVYRQMLLDSVNDLRARGG